MTISEAFYKDLVDNLYDGVYFVDRDRTITYWNHGAERITGYAAEHVVGRACRDNLLCHVTANGTQLCLSGCPLSACMADGHPREAEVFLHHADGHRVPVLVRAAPLRDSHGQILGAVETFSNSLALIDTRHELHELRRQHQTDPLTEVASRVFVEGRLHGVLAENAETGGTAGLLFIDVDHFKAVNDRFGHLIGDQMLRMVAATLRHNMRATDLVGRWGGEEFVAVLYDVASEPQLFAIAEKLRHLVASSSLDAGAASVSVTVSIGATLLRPGDDPAGAIHRADELMYQSKQAGRNTVSLGGAR
jgi:diguanylate cyclase (GGDEF)-like protein/PAS domain S-box-containing protein